VDPFLYIPQLCGTFHIDLSMILYYKSISCTGMLAKYFKVQDRKLIRLHGENYGKQRQEKREKETKEEEIKSWHDRLVKTGRCL
jgi:hypothetical protein